MKKLLAITSAITARLLSAVNHKIAVVGMLAASIAAADGASTTVNTVGTINGNGRTVLAATGNSLNVTTFSNDIATAFANNTGGVWNFESSFSVNVGETITLNFGATLSSSVVLTLTSGNNIANQSISGEAVSGSNLEALSGSAATRVYTPDKPLRAVAIFNSNRGDGSRTCALTVTFMDDTTASTSGANGGACYFHELSATGTNYIKSFAISQSNFIRYDDMAFIGTNAPPSALTVGIPTASVVNPVAQGTTNTLSASVVGGTPPYKYQWQTDGGTGGTLANIPSATNSTISLNTTGMTLGVNYNYSVVVTDGVLTKATNAVPAVVNVIQVLPGTLTATGNVAPTPGSYDISQLTEANGYQSADGLNYYTDNGNNNNKYCGQTFTTGSNDKGYTLNSLAIGLEGGANGSQATNTTYDLFIYKISTDGQTASLIADVTNLMASTFAYPNWAQWNFSGITLSSNTVYGYGFSRRSVGGYLGMATSPGGSDYYSGGQLAAFPRNGGAVIYGNSGYGDTTHDGVFNIGLIPNGVAIILNTPTATPNPAYALLPVKMADTVALAGSATTYKWLTDNGSGGYNVVPGATGTNLTVIPPDLNPGGADYVTNYYFVATDALANSATSSVIALTIHGATVPLITGPTPTNWVTFVGDRRSLTVTENGTLPITNLWQFDNGGGYVGITAQTNTTLALNNLQTTNAGSYRIVASNVVGSASSAVTLTVLPAPAAPVAANQPYYNAVYTNHPWAYWRLNETNNPTALDAPTYTAYDYSGHGFNSVYGNAVTVGNAGPQPPIYAGMDTNELAVQTTISTANAFLTPPALNLTGNSNVTFMAWINPNGAQANFAGLLMNRGGPDNGSGFGFTGTSDQLGYTWNNNSSATWGWNSGLFAAEGQWNFVAYVITPTNAVLYLGNLNGGTTNFLQATHNLNHIAQTFAGGTVRLGGDSQNLGGSFNGLITEASLFTNAMTAIQVQQYFLAGLGAPGLVPIISADVSSSAAANQYVGQALQLTAAGVGSPAPHYQWQAGTGGVFTDLINGGAISGANSGTLTINPTTVANNLDYQLVLTNVFGSATSSVYAASLVAVPTNGVWTACYQVTNSGNGSWGLGNGSYTGRGVLSPGGFWNPVPSGSQYSFGPFTSASDYLDNGSTHSGIQFTIQGQGLANNGTVFPSSDRHGLLSQFVAIFAATPNGIALSGVPNGTYNLAFHAQSGTWSDRGVSFLVHGANGDQSASTVNNVTTHNYQTFVDGETTVIITNVVVSGGILNVDTAPTPSVPAHDPNTEGYINGMEIQAVAGSVAGNPAQVSSVSVSGGQVVIKGTSPDIGQSYRILTTTNLALPLVSWIPVATNVFAGAGFSNSIPMNPANPQQFYQVVEP